VQWQAGARNAAAEASAGPSEKQRAEKEGRKGEGTRAKPAEGAGGRARRTDCCRDSFAIPLRQLAHGFARIATGVGLSPGHAQAAKRLRQAVANAPYFVAGSGRFDTRVMERLGERVFCKVGAEGVYCAALPEAGLGVAIKLDDGNNARAAEVVMAAVIEARVRLLDDEQVFMRGFSDLALRNWNGIEVGRLQASAGLRSALAS
jgi:L-asparaginase II